METQPVERVTAERRKNPKKVAAGKAAYTVKKLGNYLPNILPNVVQIVNPTNG